MLHLKIIDNGDQPVLLRSLDKLYHLHMLVLREHSCYSLPKGFNRLINLCHLLVYPGQTSGIGALTSLQELQFHAKKESGFEIRQLRDIS